MVKKGNEGMKVFFLCLALVSAFIGVGVFEDCKGHCIPEDANAMWRWATAFGGLFATMAFGYIAAVIPGEVEID
jgi:cytochrome bd-type quinol oxidase subunit 2